MELFWTGISQDSDTGGQAVDYKVYWDKGTGSWAVLADSTTNLTNYFDAVNFAVGKAYQFKVAAFNDFGVGP